MDKITMDDWRKELDVIREDKILFSGLTEEQKEIILYARSGNPIVSFKNLAEFMTKKYGKKFSRTSLGEWYKLLIENS